MKRIIIRACIMLALASIVAFAVSMSHAEAKGVAVVSQNTCNDRGCFAAPVNEVKSQHIAKKSKAKRSKQRYVEATVIMEANASPFLALSIVAKAEAYVGETAAQVGVRRSLWCAAFVNKILGGGTGSDLAYSYRTYGTKAQPGCIGCIVVSTRRGGGHVGIAKYWEGSRPVLISGNHNHRVGIGYPPGRVLALRWP